MHISWPGWKLEIFHLILGTLRVTLFAGKGADRIANGQTKNDMVMTPIIAPHTMNFGSELIQAKNFSGKSIFCSTLIGKSREGKISKFLLSYQLNGTTKTANQTTLYDSS